MAYPRAVINKRHFLVSPCDICSFLLLGPLSYLVHKKDGLFFFFFFWWRKRTMNLEPGQHFHRSLSIYRQKDPNLRPLITCEEGYPSLD
jgi:hypothetical protein